MITTRNNYAKIFIFFISLIIVIFSANAWYGEEAFKQWVATSAENGTLLIGTAHGGAYGGWADFPN